ncbi:MAG TPA: hypothetical protein VF411_13020 [Bacteroidia bacterium]
MKRFIFLVTFIVITFSSYGQGLEVVTSINTSPNIILQGAKGVGINYQFLQIDSVLFKKPIQFGIGLQYSVNSKEYYKQGDELAIPSPIYVYSDINVKVQKTSLRFHTLIALINNKNVILAIGPELSYNVFYEQGTIQSSSVKFSGGMYTSLDIFYGTIQTIELGLLTKIEIRNIFTPHLSLTFNIRPVFMYNLQGAVLLVPDMYSDLYLLSFSRFLEFQVGLKYNFSYSKKKVKY